MGLTEKVLGPKYDIKTIRRKVRNGRQDKVIEDRAAIVEDEDTQEKQLKFKSDGQKVPKPSNLSFDQLHTSGILSGGSKDFIEIEEDGDDARVIDFSYDEDKLQAERSEKQHIFQAHRNFLNKKTLEAWSKDNKTEIYILGMIITVVMINLAGMYFIVNGIEQSVVEGIVQGFQNVDVQAVQ